VVAVSLPQNPKTPKPLFVGGRLNYIVGKNISFISSVAKDLFVFGNSPSKPQ